MDILIIRNISVAKYFIILCFNILDDTLELCKFIFFKKPGSNKFETACAVRIDS